MDKDTELTKAEAGRLEKKIQDLIRKGWSEYQAREAAPIMLGLSDGDVILQDDTIAD